jgi:predicted O-linked N-acetylglucosamine transferase (SPINDLY family)
LNIEQALQQARAHAQAGDAAQAEALYRAVLQAQPDHGLANHHLGTLALQFNRADLALAPLQAALRALPGQPEVLNNLGLALMHLGRAHEGEQHLQWAVQAAPDHAEIRRSHGLCLQAAGRLQEAEAAFRQCLQLAPGSVEALNNLGHLLLVAARPGDALACFDAAIASQPGAATLHGNRGLAQLQLGQLEAAVASFRAALTRVPAHAETWNNLGITLGRLGRPEEARDSLQQALHHKPEYPQAWNNLAVILQELGHFIDAEAALHKALQQQSVYPDAHNNLGNLLRKRGRMSEAMASYQQALQQRPDWLTAMSNQLFALACSSPANQPGHLDAARHFGRVASRLAGPPFEDWLCAPAAPCLRIGLVSGDLCEHPAGYFLENLLTHADTRRIEFVAYATAFHEDELTRRLRAHLAGFHVIAGLDDESAARRIRADGVHILLDLSGHTANNRLTVFARRPAPVQAAWLGYFATTGVEQMDWVLADPVGVPSGTEAQFTERVIRLPDTRLCFTPPHGAPPVSRLPALHRGHLTLGSFQNLAKLGDAVLALWSRVLLALPQARLRLQSAQLTDAAVRQEVLQRLQALGVERARVDLLGDVSRHDYLLAHGEIDFLLDSFPYPGGTTTCEALWMGVPTLTLTGDGWLARQGAALLSAAGLGDWIAQDADEFVRLALAHGGDRQRLAALRARLREQVAASALFDAARFARHFEDAMHSLWQAREHAR